MPTRNDSEPALRAEGQPLPAPRLYVGIGGSAGSLRPLEAFFEALGDAPDICFVVVTHRGAGHEGLLSELLSNYTQMPVQQLQDPAPALAGHVYLIAPDHDLTMTDGQLTLTPDQDKQGQRAKIDRFFESLASDQGAKAVAIVLSGTGSDASQGVQAVQQTGGLTISQAPAEAAYPEMPEQAIAAGGIDKILPVAQMPGLLRAGVQPGNNEPDDAAPGAGGCDPAQTGSEEGRLHDAILSLIKSRHGRDFFHYKRGTISRRIARRMEITQTANLRNYLDKVRASHEESENLLGDLRIGVTAFFRDADAFQALETEVIPRMIEAAGVDAPALRIWVPGCATGEEAYSIAIAFSEALRAADSPRELQVFATDIDEPALATARHGLYSEQAIENVPAARRARWFDRVEGGYQVNSDLRSKVIFAIQSLIADPPFSRLDFISCRNVLIYLENSMQRQIISLFHFALLEHGHLFLGNSENIDSKSPLFASLRSGFQIYRARYQAGASHARLDWMRTDPNPITRITHMSSPHQAHDARHLSEQVPRLLLDTFAPPSVVTNERFQLLYVHGNLAPYLEFPSGAPSDDLLRMARRGIQASLRRLVSSALSAGQTDVLERARVLGGDNQYQSLEIRARRFVPSADGPACLLISFHPSVDDDHRIAPARPDNQTTGADDYLRRLEIELETTREENRWLNDELQANRQEFKTTHEEALSINEELQSSNEELESSKEEQQSLNEELSTVNSELKEKMTALREVTTDIENLLDSTDIATVFLDAEGRIKRFTPAACRLFNLIESDTGRPLTDISHVFDQALDIVADVDEVQRRRRPMENEVRTHDGRWFLRRITPYRTAEQEISGAVLSFLDVTPLKQAERTAATSEDRFRAIYDSNPAMYFIIDRSGDIASVNEFGARQLGYECNELAGHSFEGLHERPAALRKQLRDCHEQPGDIQRWELRLRCRNDELIWIRANARWVDALDQGDDAGVIFISCENITQERELREQAHFHATHDALTGLLNRREFERLLALAMESARTQERSHTLAYLDLDNFKIINDTYGHEAGDELLRQITQRMRASLQERDLLARIGGDEFALLMEDRETGQARALAQNILETIQSGDFLWKHWRLRMSTCIGLAPIHPDAGDVTTIMREADAACFAAKDLGPGSVHEHGEQDLRINLRRDEMNWAEQLRAALAEDRIEIHVQPIVYLDDPSGPCGYECLLRLRTRAGELILPGQFMDAANRYGLIRDLDQRALDLLLAFMAQAGSELKPMRWIAVNLSATSLTHPKYAAMVSTALDESGVDTSKLCFEITETSVISNLSQAKYFIHELQKRGCSFALDDFGTGLSSFEYLRELPVEYVKIDGSFIRDMLDDLPDYAMVEAIVKITHMMGKQTIAEWVESPALLATIQKMGIDYAQGYHFAYPAPLSDTLLRT